jgi:hypothetical protein
MSTSANGPGGLGHSSDEGVLGSAAQLIRVAAQSPGVVSFLFGGIITFVCVVRKIGAYEFQFVGSRNLDLGVGLTFVLIGIVWSWCSARANRRKIEEAHRKLQEIGPDRELPPEAYDLDFMMKVFYLGMPPAFVKRVHSEVASTGPAAEDILYSKRFVRFQDSPETVRLPNAPRYDKIWRDHRTGDEQAVEDGTSIQLEYPGSKVNGKLRPILTFKSSFTHGTSSYVVGWYVPVDHLEEIPLGDCVHLSQEIDQVKFRLSLAKDQNSALTAGLGEAVRDALNSGGAPV